MGDLREADAMEGVPPPEACSKLVGHERVFASLKSQSDLGRLPGGILVHGPRGIGKATLAFALARHALNRTSDETADRIREQIAAGVHPNVHVLRKILKDSKGFYTGIRVEDVRALIHKLQQTRGRAGSRFCIVDAIDDCNTSSANALLKMLEEPPADTHFILVSHKSGQLLPTLRSRCQAHALRALSETDTARVLEDSGAEPQAVQQALAFGAGRPRRVYEALHISNNEILNDLAGWLAAAPGSSRVQLMDIANNLATKKNAMEAGFAREMLLDWIAEETRKAARSKNPGPEAASSEAAQMRLASANLLWEKANTLFESADTYNLDGRQTLLSLLDAIKLHVRKTRASTMSANLE